MKHGTREGYAGGCRGRAFCPATLSCEETYIRAAGDWAFAKLIDAGMSGPEAAAELERREAEDAEGRALREADRLAAEKREKANARRRARERERRDSAPDAPHGTRRGVDMKRCTTDEECPHFGTDKPTCRQAYNSEQRRMYQLRKQRAAVAA